jgi:hypothetical protein
VDGVVLMAIASQRRYISRRRGESPYEMLISGAQAIYGIKIIQCYEGLGYGVQLNNWWEFKNCLEKGEYRCPYDDGIIMIGV